MRIRIDSDNAKKVNAARKKNGAEGKPLSAHQEVNKALAAHYASDDVNWKAAIAQAYENFTGKKLKK